ncbi:hypothetical protein EKN09_05435 [Vibrio penaeicida]|uniref:Uncharacterized protein n=1 Tax=Vibrio penaeicida TaxID=104609 RepID=A0AAV5P0M8_9VIBR|nr:hypothetical protein [Vibrio penaeicida]RTZ24104.1 hypothetical protein EKN09_05435 [Vibrio penaeicida]GLQ76327.1 hypothetical protein GCM10007932_56900 [Vibrio penaeicida]
MLSNTLKVVTLIALLVCTFSASANTEKYVPTQISVELGNVYIWNASYINTKGCDLSGVVKLNRDALGFQEMYSMVLTAYTAKKPIGFWIRSCESSPWGKTIPTAYMSYM